MQGKDFAVAVYTIFNGVNGQDFSGLHCGVNSQDFSGLDNGVNNQDFADVTAHTFRVKLRYNTHVKNIARLL